MEPRQHPPESTKDSLTRSQAQVLKLMQHLDCAVSAQELFTMLRNQHQNIGLATVYRTLKALTLRGIVQLRTSTNGESLYSLVEQDTHHLTCLNCGQSFPLKECPVHELEANLRSSQAFKIYYHTLEFFGLCSLCQLQLEVGT
ncbi:MAG: transcriptional repressor [Chroococcidiopsidaceae cyanobacterium CP_BM_ER_R8_30]|nr:transcriptional repressor [Chroococcidiopsidaceae cyanobacterium CP_BM_ER_R8_30]